METYRDLLSQIHTNCKNIPFHKKLSAYNIFDVLEIQSREVIMCRFLTDLLNPEGMHGCGIRFLKSFIRDVLKMDPVSDTLLLHTEVVKEYPIDKERRIDIFIRNAEYQIPIEVKIYAGEQEGQCSDYFEMAQNSRLIYLTRFGTPPSEYSRKKKGGGNLLPLGQIQCISWAEDIYRWLGGELQNLKEPFRAVMEQYLDAVHSIADEREKKVADKVIEALYESPEKFLAGIEIEKSMKKAKVRLIRQVFEEFQQQMQPILEKYGLKLEKDSGYYSYQDPQHDKFYDCYSTYPGLNYVVKKAKFQKAGLELWFRIEVEHNLFAGFCLFDKEASSKDGFSKGYQVDDITDGLKQEASRYLKKEIILPEDWWFAWCYPNGKRYCEEAEVPDFKQMNSCAVSLVDETARREYVKRALAVFERELLGWLL